jgi:hypothetical protein
MVISTTFLSPRGHNGSDTTTGEQPERTLFPCSAALWRCALIIASLRDARSDPFAVGETWLLPSIEWQPPESPPARPVTGWRRTMPISHLAKATFDHARRRAALGLFRLASLILRRATDLFQRRQIARVALRVALAAAKLLERSAGVLLLGTSRPKDQPDRGKTGQS